jgi:CRP/FNR family transcriptional regulator
MKVEQPSLEQLGRRLQKIPFFEQLKAPALQELVLAARWQLFAPGEIVFLEGESSPGLYYLHFGWLKVVKSSTEGREQVLRFLEPGDTFNEIGAFARKPNPATAIALEPAGIWILPRGRIEELIDREPEFARQVIEKMAERVMALVELVADLSLRPVIGRLARLLLESAEGDILYRPRWYTQAELAARLGTVPDVVQRALRTLEADGAIQVERHLIRILDPQSLEEKAS